MSASPVIYTISPATSSLEKQILRVLLIEDDYESYELVKIKLSVTSNQQQYIVNWQPEPKEALKELILNRYDIYIVDYKLPLKNGLDIVEEALLKGCKKPIILLTHHDDPYIANRALSVGVSDYLVKSEISASMLDRSIRYAISHKAIQNRKQSLVSTLANDIKAPLNSSKTVLKSLREGASGELNSEQEACIAELVRTNQLMLQLVNNLEAAYKYEDGELHLSKEPVQLETIIRSIALGELLAITTRKEQQLLFESDDALPQMSLDPLRIYQAAYNLVANAVEYTQAKGTIRISIQKVDDVLRVMVRDDGPGIDVEKQKNLFLPIDSRQHESPLSRGGLGLYIAKQVIQLHGGSIGFESTLGEGSCFYFSLPIVSPAVQSTSASPL